MSSDSTALAVVATGLLALVASVPVQVLWLVAALAASVAAMRARPPNDDPGPSVP